MGLDSKAKNLEASYMTSPQAGLKENDMERTFNVGRYLEDSRELFSNLCNISVEYIEVATRAQERLRDYWIGLAKMQLDPIANLPSYGFMKKELMELLSCSIISAAQFWINSFILPWKLALANTLCIEPKLVFLPMLEQKR
jgi:hypothetical protein